MKLQMAEDAPCRQLWFVASTNSAAGCGPRQVFVEDSLVDLDGYKWVIRIQRISLLLISVIPFLIGTISLADSKHDRCESIVP
jgi:hypothetical protein